MRRCLQLFAKRATLSSYKPLAKPSFTSPLQRFANQVRDTGPFQFQRHASTSPKALQERIAAIPIERFRNFSVIAHIDHGKSTLSDRLLELTGTIEPGGAARILDKLEVEKQRGITVKAQECTMLYNYEGEDYLLHLVDTPGHVDFRAEVSRSYASCGGALILVDASQGVQAQTNANYLEAFSQGLKLVPVLNKIDLPSADIERTKEQIRDSFEITTDDTLQISAKTGLGVETILPAVIEQIPPPEGDPKAPLQLLLIDSWYDNYKGVILLVRIFNGQIKAGDKVSSFVTKKTYTVGEVGIMYPEQTPQSSLRAGQIGYMHFTPGMKNVRDAKVGDTYSHTATMSQVEQLPGFREPKAMVYASAYPENSEDFVKFEDKVYEHLLNDKSVSIDKEASVALGSGFRLGFLGSLHCDILTQRLKDEHDTEIMITSPSVPYKIKWKDGKEKVFESPADFPDSPRDALKIAETFEPVVTATIILPHEYIGPIIKLCQDSRGIQKDLSTFNKRQTMLEYEMPVSALASNFFTKLKSATHGYGEVDYVDAGWRSAPLEKLVLLINREPFDAISRVVHHDEAQRVAKLWALDFKGRVQRQLFEVIIQVATRAGKNVLARETLPAFRKDVTAKLHAADVSRRRKLLEKQKEGRKKLRSVGSVHVEQKAFKEFLAKRF